MAKEEGQVKDTRRKQHHHFRFNFIFIYICIFIVLNIYKTEENVVEIFVVFCWFIVYFV